MKRQVPEELKLRYIERVADSATFVRAEQLRRLFRWLGAKSLEGGAPPTEYEVARGALGRPENFDPQTDSLVRKEMNRLRVKLRDYYLKEGDADAVEIRNQGPYKLTFEFKRMSETSDPLAKYPCVLVLPLYGEPGMTDAAEAFYGEFQAQIATTGQLEVVAQTTARQYGRRGGDVREFAAATGASFVVEGTARKKDSAILITLFLVDGETGRTRRPCRLTGLDIEDLAVRGARWLSKCLSRPPLGVDEDSPQVD